jgi:glycosyltransferase involved in cell wall biosynthesis
MKVSIVIPFKDEALRLPKSLETLEKYAAGQYFDIELILVDDGSTDDTVGAIQMYMNQPHVRFLRHKHNRGKGAALRTGVAHTSGDYILCCDADFSTPITELTKLLHHIQEADIVIGSRAMPKSRIVEAQSKIRQYIGRSGNILIRLVLGLPFYDTQCGFKLYRQDCAQRLFHAAQYEGFSIDYEILYAAKQAGDRIKEVGVIWKHSAPSTVHPFYDSVRALRDLFKIRFGRSTQRNT